MALLTMLVAYVDSVREREDGISAIEYGLMAVLIALAFTAGAGLLGDALDALFTAIAGDLAAP